jgi:hypothetical protein
MGEYLDKYRREVCEKEGHAHGEGGQVECMLRFIAAAQARLAMNSL